MQHYRDGYRSGLVVEGGSGPDRDRVADQRATRREQRNRNGHLAGSAGSASDSRHPVHSRRRRDRAAKKAGRGTGGTRTASRPTEPSAERRRWSIAAVQLNPSSMNTPHLTDPN